MSQQKSIVKLVQWQEVLLALYRVADGATISVPYEEIVVRAWRDFPQDFALRNYPEYPDASDMHKRLSDMKSRGLIVSLGNKVFRLTDKGVRVAAELERRLAGKETTSQQARLRLSRREEAFIQHALKSQAFAAWLDGDAEKLIEYDAQLFFRFSTSTPDDERGRRVDIAREAVAKARRMKMEHAEALASLIDYLTVQFGHLWEES